MPENKKPKTLEDLQNELITGKKKIKFEVQEVEINPIDILGEEYGIIPSGFNFKCDGVNYVINHNCKKPKITRVRVI